jgi:hypothetical protein
MAWYSSRHMPSLWLPPKIAFRGRVEIGGVYISALSAGAYTSTLLVMVDECLERQPSRSINMWVKTTLAARAKAQTDREVP